MLFQLYREKQNTHDDSKNSCGFATAQHLADAETQFDKMASFETRLATPDDFWNGFVVRGNMSHQKEVKKVESLAKWPGIENSTYLIFHRTYQNYYAKQLATCRSNIVYSRFVTNLASLV